MILHFFRPCQLQNSFSRILQLALFAFMAIYQFAEASFSFLNLFQRETDSICIDNAQDFHILERFFKMGVYDEEYGYVLEGAKPISCRHFYPLHDFPISNDLDRSVEEFEKTILVINASKIWDKYFSKNENFILNIVPLNNADFDCEVRFINFSLLKDTIANNIDLFRYVLGPTLDAEQFAHRLAFSNEELHNILNHDLVLIGIVLGFGSHNCIVEGRIEKLQMPISKDCAPLLPKSCLMQSKEERLLNFLTPEQFGPHYLKFAGSGDDSIFRSEYSQMRPNLEFTSLEEELSALLDLEEPLPSCLEQRPAFIFGASKKGASNRNLFGKLVKSQKKIKSMLAESDFLERILKKMTGKAPVIKYDKSTNLHPVMNAEDWISLLNKVADRLDSSEERISFIEAFCQNIKISPPKMIGANKTVLEGLKKALNNLSESTLHFEKLSHDASLETIVPKQLYFKTANPGSGKSLKENDRIRVSYTVEDLEGNILFAHSDTWLKVSETVQGFAHGVQGMQVGEKRTLFIHPTLAYGALTTLPPCIPLQIKVQLLDFDEQFAKALHPLIPLDLGWLQNPKFYRTIEESIKAMPGFRGSSYRLLVDKIDHLEKAKVIAAMQDRVCEFSSN